MKDKKNRAVISHREKTFVVYQDDKDNWCYTFEELVDINSQSKELQTAINMAKETINERVASSDRSKSKLGNWKVEGKYPIGEGKWKPRKKDWR